MFLRPSTVFRPTVSALAAAVIGLGAAGACSSGAPTANAPDATIARLDNFPSGNQSADRARLDSLKAVARATAKSGPCADGNCAAIGLGAKPCGGPWEYVTYCPTTTDGARLRAVADEVARAERLFNERYNIASDCSVAAEPACAVKPTS